MKKCIVVSISDAKFSALAFKEDVENSVRKVAELGFDAVELHVRDPKEVDADSIKQLVTSCNLSVPAIGTGQVYGEDGLSFTHSDKNIREKAVQRIKTHVDFAAHFNAQVIIGLVRGKLQGGMAFGEAEKYFIECMRECGDYAAKKDVILTVEPINRYETDLYNTVEEMLEVISKIDRKNIGILADTFHMNIEEPDIFESLKKAGDRITHVHFADSNRWAPGCGHIDFDKVVSTLKEIGYNGAVSAEILPKPSPEESARLTIEHMKRIGL